MRTEMPEKLSAVGKPLARIDARELVTGQAGFVSDLEFPGMLHGRILRSPHPHALIRNIDTSKAEALPGVRAVITYKDTPGIRFGPMREDWEILASDKVRFVGDEVAAVAAIDPDVAEEALDLIGVEYEELPAVFDPREALSPEAPKIHSQGNLVSLFKLNKGDVDQAFRGCDYVYRNSYYTSQVYHAYLEPMACVVKVDLSGKVNFFLGIQCPFPVRALYARALNISADKVRVVTPHYGGGFGGKQPTNLHLVAALLSQKTGKPVRMVNTRQEDFEAGNPRVPMYIDIAIGVKKDGTIMGKEVRVVGAAGARVVSALAVVSTACYRVDSLYHFRNLRTEGSTVYTNTVPTGAMRGFGNAEMTFAVESTLDALAHELEMDPAQFRLENAIRANEISIHGWKIKSCGLEQCIEEATRKANWTEKRKQKVPYRGIGLACCNHVSGSRVAAIREFDGGAGIVRIDRGGKVRVYHGESDMGQGQKTIFAQIVAEELGISIFQVEVAQVDTDTSPFGIGSIATRGTLMGGNGVRAAAADAKRQIFELAAEMLEASPCDLESWEGKIFVKGSPERFLEFKEVAEKGFLKRCGAPIVGTGFYKSDTEFPDPITHYGNISPAYPFACQIAEVEVDPETGKVTLTNFVAAHDVGKAINPQSTEGQIHGGVVQGIGWALMEDMISKDGKILNPDFTDYIIPGPMDLPPIQTILVEPIDPEGPFGAKGIGEPALNPTAAAVANAIFDATGLRMTQLPMTQEKILFAIKKKLSG